MNVQRLIVMCVAAGCAGSVLAKDPKEAKEPKEPYYASLSVGATHADVLDNLRPMEQALNALPNAPLGSDIRLSERQRTATGVRLSVGRQWGPVWSTELAYSHYGSVKARTPDGASPEADTWVAVNGYDAMSVWRARTEMDIILVTRLGVAFNESRTVVRSAELGVDTVSTGSTWAPIYGLGMEYGFAPGWRLQFTADATSVKMLGERRLVKFYALGASRSF